MDHKQAEFTEIYQNLLTKSAAIAVVGLGYVGMPIAVEYAKKGISVIGFDHDAKKIRLYQEGYDPTMEVGDEEIKKTKVNFTADALELKKASFIIIAVPTPVNTDHTPNLTPVENASAIV